MKIVHLVFNPLQERNWVVFVLQNQPLPPPPFWFKNIPHILPSPGRIIISGQVLKTQLPWYSGHQRSGADRVREVWLLLSQREPITDTSPFYCLTRGRQGKNGTEI